jgi:hypothetical protein
MKLRLRRNRRPSLAGVGTIHPSPHSDL